MTTSYVKWAVFASVGGAFLITGYLAGSGWLLLSSIVIFAAIAVDHRDEVRGQR